jgi:hypothetical protein
MAQHFFTKHFLAEKEARIKLFCLAKTFIRGLSDNTRLFGQ